MRGGGPGGTQQALLQKAKRKPGHLAAKMLGKMRALLDHEPVLQNPGPPRPAAEHFVHTVSAGPGSQATLRDQREMLTLAKIVDLLAEGKAGAAADVATQRLKSVDKAIREGTWEQARYLELLPTTTAALADRAEDFMAAKETRLFCPPLREKSDWCANSPETPN